MVGVREVVHREDPPAVPKEVAAGADLEAVAADN